MNLDNESKFSGIFVLGNAPNCMVREERIPVFSPSKKGEFVDKANNGAIQRLTPFII